MKLVDKKKVNGVIVALIDRETGYQPWVVAWNYDEAWQQWGQGHYFNEFEMAARYYMDNYRR